MLNKALRLIRVFHDLSQTELAARLGIGKSTLSEIEKGTKPASLDLLRRYSEEFRIPISSILFFAENVDAKGGIDRAKTFVSRRILSIMEFISERSGRDQKESA